MKMMERNIKHSGWVTFSLVVASVALLIDLVWCVTMMLGEGAKFVIFIISAFSIIVILPVFILDFAGFISSFSSKDPRKNLLKGLSGAGIGLLVISGFLLINGRVDVEKLEKNYCIHSSEIEQAIDYTLSCLEEGMGLDIEFKDNGSVELFHIGKEGNWVSTWNPSRDKVDSLSAEIGLNREKLNAIRDRLFKAKCHSISIVKKDGTYNVATLMFRRDLASAYYYDIHKDAMTEAEMEAVDAEDCSRIAFNPHVCFVYGGPAFGSIAFPGKQKYLEERHGKQ